MGVTLDETPSNRDMESEVSTFCSQAGTTVEGIRTPSHPQNLVLSIRNAGTDMEQRPRKWPTNNWTNLRPIPWVSTKFSLY